MAEPTKAELQLILEEEQAKLAAAEKVKLEQLERIETLEKQLSLSAEEIEQLKSVEGVITCINKLSLEEKKLLTHEARTTKNGIAAFKAINYGISSTIAEAVMEDQMKAQKA